MASTWKTAQLFIFSMFRDMRAERDHLIIKVTFAAMGEKLMPLGSSCTTSTCGGVSP
jgi:hypothetical protein